MKKVITLVLVVLSCVSVQSQNRNCGTMQHLDEIRQNDPQVDQRMQVEESEIQNWIANNPESSMLNVLTIPVVVHVIYKTSSQNISTAQVQSQIDILNEDFRKLNLDASSVPSAFSGVAADVEIEFCLAVRDPNGNTTTGITRTSTASSSFSGYTSMKYASSGGHDAWNTSKYLNIWVCNLASGLLGFATFPGGSSSTDGVVCDYAYFGDIGTATSPYHLGRTATHEVGHWLNLSHIWGDSNCGTDYVSDTPTQQGSNYGCPSFPSTSSCIGNGSNGDMFMNYMDYTNDACMYMFSAGQKTRMRATLNGSRSSLLSSNGCVPVNIPIVISANVTDVSCNGNTNGSIDISVSGGLSPFTYSWSNGFTSQDISNLNIGVYTVSVTDAQGQIQTASYTIAEPTAISISYNAVSTSAPGAIDGAIYTTTNGGVPPYTFYWVSPYAITQNLINIAAGAYTFYAIDANNCFSMENITVQDGVIVPVTASEIITDVSCAGNNDGAIDLTVSGGVPPFSYSWTNGMTTEDITGVSGGSYGLTITDSQNQTFSTSYIVNEDLPLNLSYVITNASSVTATDGAIDLTVSGGQSPYVYFWNTNPSQSTEDISGLNVGDYVVYVGYNSWSCFVSDTVTVLGIISGCTDPLATNYDATATIDDGSCTYPANCNAYPTGLNVFDVIDTRVNFAWDNMNTANCMVLKYYVRYREVGASAWNTRAAGVGNGLCNFGLNTTSQMLLGLTASTTYEWKLKAFYCGGTSSNYSPVSTFTTADACPILANLAVQTYASNHTKANFTWDSTGAYLYARVALRVDTVGAAWQTVGGFGTFAPTMSQLKFGLVAGESYRAGARAYCNATISAHRSWWTPFVFWTQPGALIKIEGGAAIANLAIYPNPSSDVFNISFTSENVQDLKVRVLNVIGEELINENLQQFIGEYTKKINLSDNAKGVYFLEIETNDGVINKKLILQ
jgi:hypothetical protein